MARCTSLDEADLGVKMDEEVEVDDGGHNQTRHSPLGALAYLEMSLHLDGSKS